MRKLVIVLLCILFCNLSMIGQTLFPEIEKVLDFPTPNAASFGKFNRIPVSHFNGLPEIEIPLYTINLKDLEIPIRLRYHASGVKPDDHPGWTGIGWSLEAGGCISRIVNGVKDETLNADILAQYGYSVTEKYLGNYFINGKVLGDTWFNDNPLIDLATKLPNMHYDTEPDEFIFNAPGLNGSFYFIEQNGIKTIKVKSKQNANIQVETIFSEKKYMMYH